MNRRRKEKTVTLEKLAIAGYNTARVAAKASVIVGKVGWEGAKLGYQVGKSFFNWSTATKQRMLNVYVGGALLFGVISDVPKNYEIVSNAQQGIEQLAHANWNGPPLFNDENANKTAIQKGITPGDYFIFNDKTMDKLAAFTDDELYPVFPPAVAAQSNLIYDLSAKTKIPPNVVAVIMSMESAGDVNAQSNLGAKLEDRAQGLCQVMPLHFFPDFGKEYVLTKNPNLMLNPEIGCGLGMNFLSQVLALAREELAKSGYSENHASVFGRAFIAYNGGGSTVKRKFHELYEESQFYGDHPERYFLDMEIAAGLRKAGYSDASIVKAMVSPEIDARTFALNYWLSEIRKERKPTYNDYNFASNLLSTPVIGESAKSPAEKKAADFLKEHYSDFVGNPRLKEGYPMFMYEHPLAPALRIWASGLGGAKLLAQSPLNKNVLAYETVLVRRN